MIAVAVGMIFQDRGWIVVGPIGRLELAIEASAKAEFDCANGEYADRVAPKSAQPRQTVSNGDRS